MPTQKLAKTWGPDYGGKLSYNQLQDYTNNFSDKNFLGTFQFGKVYRGSGSGPPIDMVVKIWDNSEKTHSFRGNIEAKVMLELNIFRNDRLNSYPGMLKLYGFCWCNKLLGVVYICNSLATLHNLVPKDSFTWIQRIKVAVGFAQILKFLHTKRPPFVTPFLVRNIDAAHIVLDERHNPKLFDFSMISGGLFDDTTKYEHYLLYKSYEYIDPSIRCTGKWSEKTDVFAFGVILLNLITKSIRTEEDSLPLYEWAWSVYQPNRDNNIEVGNVSSLVHQSLRLDPDFSSIDGLILTKLTMECINRNPDQRPTMRQVIGGMLKLQVVKEHEEFLEFDSGLRAVMDKHKEKTETSKVLQVV